MKKQIKIWGVMLMIVLVSSYAVALEKPVLQQASTSTQPVISGQENPVLQQAGATQQLVIGAQDVITASDAGGGFLASRDMLIIILICAVVLVAVLVL